MAGPPERLGKYSIVKEIGRGGFATVYRAVDTTLEREVALKVLDPLLMRDEAFVARFEREARAAANLEHPHIVPIYEVGATDDRLFIAMRLVRGHNLAGRLEAQGRIPWDATLDILRQVSAALAYAHEEGVIHRDIKPHNILLDDRSGVMLTDFGFARLVGTSTLTQSLSGGIVGTPAYIAPETWEGREATPATDVYALACVVYEMLTGEVLFDETTPMAVMRAHDQGAQLPQEWPIDVPPGTGEALARALSRQQEDRYGGVPESLVALETLQTAAVRERTAAEVARLADQMHQALGSGSFQAAVSAGERLLDLQPDHSEGARLLGQAQAKLARTGELAQRLKEEEDALDQEMEKLNQEKAELAGQLAQLAAEERRWEAERTEVEQHLTEVQDALAHCAEGMAGSRERLQTVEHRSEELARRAEALGRAAALVAEGQIEAVENLLAEGTAASPTGAVQPAVSGAQPADVDRESLLAWWALVVTGLLLGAGTLWFAPELGVVIIVASCAGLALLLHLMMAER